jgi:hypothetical protein
VGDQPIFEREVEGELGDAAWEVTLNQNLDPILTVAHRFATGDGGRVGESTEGGFAPVEDVIAPAVGLSLVYDSARLGEAGGTSGGVAGIGSVEIPGDDVRGRSTSFLYGCISIVEAPPGGESRAFLHSGTGSTAVDSPPEGRSRLLSCELG